MGAAASDMMMKPRDVSHGYSEFYGLVSIHTLASHGDHHKVSICLKKGADPNEKSFPEDDTFNREDTVMICAARGDEFGGGTKNHVNTLEIILKFGGKINTCNRLKQTALQLACQRGFYRVAKWLLNHGADVHAADKAGMTPLHWASKINHLKLVYLLLDHNAKVFQPTRSFSTCKYPGIFEMTRNAKIRAALRIRNKEEKIRWKISEKARLKREMEAKQLSQMELERIKVAQRRELRALKRQEKLEYKITLFEDKMGQDMIEGLEKSRDEEETRERMARASRLNGTWEKFQRLSTSNQDEETRTSWRIVKLDPMDRKNRRRNDVWAQSEELMRSLVKKQQKHRLRPLYTAPDSVALHLAQAQEFDLAQWNNSTTFRPTSVPIIGSHGEL